MQNIYCVNIYIYIFYCFDFVYQSTNSTLQIAVQHGCVYKCSSLMIGSKL